MPHPSQEGSDFDRNVGGRMVFLFCSSHCFPANASFQAAGSRGVGPGGATQASVKGMGRTDESSRSEVMAHSGQ